MDDGRAYCWQANSINKTSVMQSGPPRSSPRGTPNPRGHKVAERSKHPPFPPSRVERAMGGGPKSSEAIAFVMLLFLRPGQILDKKSKRIADDAVAILRRDDLGLQLRFPIGRSPDLRAIQISRVLAPAHLPGLGRERQDRFNLHRYC